MPNVTFYLNRSTGFWFANVYWPDTQERKRYSLRTRSETQARLGDLARWSAHVSGQISGLKRI
jgi:hypothetical protein